MSAKCVSTCFIFLVSVWLIFLISTWIIFLQESSVCAYSLYLENLPFHLVSKAVREQSHQCNLSRCGSEWIRLQEMVWDCFSRSLLFFSLLYSGKIESPSGRERLSGSQAFKMQVSKALDWVSSAWQEQNLVQKASKSPWPRYYPCGSSHRPRRPGLSLLSSSVKCRSAFSCFFLPPSSLNCRCPGIWTSSQRK